MCIHSHLFTWKLTCAWPSSHCSVLISLLCAAKGMGGGTVSTVGWGNLTEAIVWLWQSWGGEFLLSLLLFVSLDSQWVFLWSHICVWDQLGHPFAVGQESSIWGVHWPDPRGLTSDAHLLGLWVLWEIGQGVERTKAPALCWDCDKQLFPTFSPCFRLSSQIDFFGALWTMEMYLQGLWVGCRGNAGSCRGKVQE